MSVPEAWREVTLLHQQLLLQWHLYCNESLKEEKSCEFLVFRSPGSCGSSCNSWRFSVQMRIFLWPLGKWSRSSSSGDCVHRWRPNTVPVRGARPSICMQPLLPPLRWRSTSEAPSLPPVVFWIPSWWPSSPPAVASSLYHYNQSPSLFFLFLRKIVSISSELLNYPAFYETGLLPSWLPTRSRPHTL